MSLDELKKEIYQYGKRRCDVEASSDNLKYYVGIAFEVNKALDLPGLALTGLLSLPTEAFGSLFEHEEEVPATVIGLLRYAPEKPDVRDWATDMGIWLQWKRAEAIYRAEVTDFKNSDALLRLIQLSWYASWPTFSIFVSDGSDRDQST